MRRGLVFLLPLLVASLAYLAWRSVPRPVASAATCTERAELGTSSQPVALEEAVPIGSSRAAPAGVLRFEPLPEEPSEIVVHLVDGVTEQPILGAEVFVLDLDEQDWPGTGFSSDLPNPDIEAELRARGRRIESDAKGELHLPIPRAWLAVMARKDGLFGEASVGFDSAPETTLRLYSSRTCVVRTRNRAGAGVAGVEVVLRRGSRGEFWRGLSSSDGEALIPNLGWLLAENCRDEETWCATVSDACFDPPARWFEVGEALPESIDLTLPDAQRLELQLETSDGALAPIGGWVSFSTRSSSGSSSVLRLPRVSSPRAPLVNGRALLARAEPGSWLDCDVWLAGEQSFSSSVRVSEAGAASTQATLRIPEYLQIVLARPLDANGEALANREFEWVSWAQEPNDDIEHDRQEGEVKSDAQGLLVLALARTDLFPNEPDDPDELAPQLAWRGVLRLRGPGQELESAPIHFSTLGPGATRNLGTLRLAPATPLVRGHVIDDRGRPLAHVDVGIEQLHSVDGQVETDASGAFAIYGSCPGGILTLRLDRYGYRPAHAAPEIRFDCGSSPDLTLELVRTGAVHISARTPRTLTRGLCWVLDDGVQVQDRELDRARESELVESEFDQVRPGSCRVRLENRFSDDAPLMVLEDVLVRPGERTLDPRLCEVDLSRFAAESDEPAPGAPKDEAVVLQVVDREGGAIPTGRLFEAFTCFRSDSVWRGGRVRIEASRSYAHYTIWSPGYCAWSGDCPERSGELRLEPAWHIGFVFEVPAALRKPCWLLQVVPHVVSSDFGSSGILHLLSPAQLGGDGQVSFEIPGPCEMSFTLQLIALDPTGTTIVEGLEPQELTDFFMPVPPGDNIWEIEVPPERWEAAEKALAGKR